MRIVVVSLKNLFSKLKKYNTILTIAGSDSGGGAGIQADIKAISACGGFAASVITAVTSQNTVGVRGVFGMPAHVVESQLRAVLDDIAVDAVKIGMVGSAEVAELIGRVLVEYGVRNIVLDPVLVATSGDELSGANAMEAILKFLVPIATVVTPNLEEARRLAGFDSSVGSASFANSANSASSASSASLSNDYSAAWDVLRERWGAQAVLVKGGHGSGDVLEDVLYVADNMPVVYTNMRIYTQNTHGTGCSLSSAMATFLGRGLSLTQATAQAVAYLHNAIVSGDEYSFGHGHGPVNHFGF